MALALAAFAQEIIEPRPIPRLAEEQREVQRFIRLANHCSATYTEAAGAIGQGGWVRVQSTISTEGEPIAPRVIDCSPAGFFEAAALEGIRIVPRIVDGKAVPIEGAMRLVSFLIPDRSKHQNPASESAGRASQ